MYKMFVHWTTASVKAMTGHVIKKDEIRCIYMYYIALFKPKDSYCNDKIFFE